MVAIYDQTSLSDNVSAKVTRALGFWNEWKAKQAAGERQQALLSKAEEHLCQTLTHDSKCGYLEEFANDGIKLCRIQLENQLLSKMTASIS